MNDKDKNRQDKMMQMMLKFFKGKEILKPMNTGWIDGHVACVREYSANIFFYTKNSTTIMIDAGSNYERLEEKMKWLNIFPRDISHIFLTHLDADRVGAIQKESPVIFPDAKFYLGSLENQYLTGLMSRKVLGGFSKLQKPELQKPPILLKDGAVMDIDGIRVEALLVPGHTWGHMVYLIDETYLFTGDTIWLGPDGGYSYVNALAEDNKLAVESLGHLKERLKERELKPIVISAHTGWTDDFSFAFAHVDQVCNALKKQTPHDPDAPVNPYDESMDIEKRARMDRLPQRKK